MGFDHIMCMQVVVEQ